MAKIYRFEEHNFVVEGEKEDILYLARCLRAAEGTVGDLAYKIEYTFDVDGVRSDYGYEEDYDDPDYADRYLKTI